MWAEAEKLNRRGGEAHSKGKSKRISKIFHLLGFLRRSLCGLEHFGLTSKALSICIPITRETELHCMIDRRRSFAFNIHSFFDESTDLFKFRITSYIIAFAVLFSSPSIRGKKNSCLDFWLFDLVGSSSSSLAAVVMCAEWGEIKSKFSHPPHDHLNNV